ncbi:MAG TPA: DUF4097 family beta strand repeat-containing protein [Puia sp.]
MRKNTIIRTFAGMALLLITGMEVSAQKDKETKESSNEQLVVPLSSPGKHYSLRVGITTGSIKVVSYPGKEIVIDVHSRGRGSDDGDRDEGTGMRRIHTPDGYEVTAHEDDNNVTVHNSNPNKSMDLSLKIPQDVKLTLSTVNGGDIDVENIKGEIEVQDVNGSIRLTNIEGSVVANSVNGGVTVSFLSVDPKAPMAFSTLNGNVDVTLPASTKANLKLKSDRGEIFSDFDIAIDKSEPKVVKSSDNKMYKLEKEDWVKGTINGGGVEILMKNMQGGIYIHKAK